MTNIKNNLELRLAPRLIISPVLQQSIELLALPRLELQHLIQNQLQENPLLEEVPLPEYRDSLEDYQTSQTGDGQGGLREIEIDWENYMWDNADLGYVEDQQDTSSPEINLTKSPSLPEHLIWQLNLSSKTEREKQIGMAIIEEIDGEGYFRGNLAEIAGRLKIKKEEVEEVLQLIQTFDPPGVGARNLKECLLLQIRDLEEDRKLLERIIKRHLEELQPANYAKIASSLKVPLERIIKAARTIRTLNPKPGTKFQNEPTEYIIPDVIVIKEYGEYKVIVNDEGLPRLRINPLYKSILRGNKGLDGKIRQYVEEKFRSAIWLIKGIEQRRKNLYKVACSIVKFQRDFLDHGINHLKPLVLRDVAQDIDVHESTVSRINNNKYMDTPQGLFEFKFFFHSSLGTVAGGQRSSITVKNTLKELINNEDPNNPYTDDQLVELFRRNNIIIARRTINKYRRELGIPDSSQRKRLAQSGLLPKFT